MTRFSRPFTSQAHNHRITGTNHTVQHFQRPVMKYPCRWEPKLSGCKNQSFNPCSPRVHQSPSPQEILQLLRARGRFEPVKFHSLSQRGRTAGNISTKNNRISIRSFGLNTSKRRIDRVRNFPGNRTAGGSDVPQVSLQQSGPRVFPRDHRRGDPMVWLRGG